MRFDAIRRFLGWCSDHPGGLRADPNVAVRLARPEERDPILAFVRSMGFNARDAKTWDGLGMGAMTAWDGDKLIGAIPLEPRCWQLRPGCVVASVHQTTVGVLPEYQGRGIGSRMQEELFQHPPPGVELATVFREDETSPAYRWYRRNGFRAAMRIAAWLLKTPTRPAAPPVYEVLDFDHPGVDWGGIDRLWQAGRVDQHGGFVCRSKRPRRDWLDAHPYRGHYTYRILQIRTSGELAAYAILGVGQLHSETIRVEIMEHAAGAAEQDPDNDLKHLIQATIHYAAEHDYRPVRWALTVGDPEAAIARELGFTQEWVFDLLMRPLPNCEITLPDAEERRRQWRYHSLDYS